MRADERARIEQHIATLRARLNIARAAKRKNAPSVVQLEGAVQLAEQLLRDLVAGDERHAAENPEDVLPPMMPTMEEFVRRGLAATHAVDAELDRAQRDADRASKASPRRYGPR